MLYIAERSHPAVFQAIAFARDLLEASGAAFYRVDGAMAPFDYTLYDIPMDFHRGYVEGMSRYDPLSIDRLEHKARCVAQLDEAGADMPDAEVMEYRRFFHAFDISDSIEFVFRRRDRVFAGMSLTWRGGARLTAAQDRIKDKLHAYLEFNLEAAFDRDAPARAERYGLTAREREVVDLVCCGRTNQEIAGCLQIGLATVKTHLIHVFDKLGVDNRSAVVALIAKGG